MPDAPPALRALVDAAIGLARRTASGRLFMGRAEPVVHADLLPERIRRPVRAELESALAATATPLAHKDVEALLRKAWGKAPGKVLDELGEQPLSVSPVALVLAGELDGEPVAVKVSRPGVAANVRGELALLDVLVGPLGAVFRALDVGATLRELREGAMDELDLHHEGDQQQRMRRALRRLDGIVVPAVEGDLAADDVLVMERLDGPTLAERDADEPEVLARRLIAAHLTAWRELGLVPVDARPSHVVLLRNGDTGLLGLGVARPAPRERCDAGIAAFAALGDADPAAFVEAVSANLGVLPPDAARDAHGVLREVLGDLVTGEARLDGPALAAAAERAFARLGDLMRLAAQTTPHPSDLAALRMVGQLTALLSRLGVTASWPDLVRDVG